jgi:D-lyxose ketol-isomerase
LFWGDGRSASIGPGDSAYIRPMVEHWLQGPAGACLAMSRIAGELVDDVFDEFATFATDGRSRALAETKRWF